MREQQSSIGLKVAGLQLRIREFTSPRLMLQPQQWGYLNLCQQNQSERPSATPGWLGGKFGSALNARGRSHTSLLRSVSHKPVLLPPFLLPWSISTYHKSLVKILQTLLQADDSIDGILQLFCTCGSRHIGASLTEAPEHSHYWHQECKFMLSCNRIRIVSSELPLTLH